jgi:hypothetical protein
VVRDGIGIGDGQTSLSVISLTTAAAGPVSTPSAVQRGAQIVDDDRGALLGQQQRDAATDATSDPVTSATRPSSVPMPQSPSLIYAGDRLASSYARLPPALDSGSDRFPLSVARSPEGASA